MSEKDMKYEAFEEIKILTISRYIQAPKGVNK